MKQEQKKIIVQINNLVKRFNEVLAVNNISCQVEEGEFLTLLGPSGSGKTTTLMMIAGFEIPDSGEIFIDDKQIMFQPAYKRGIGIVFQNYSLFPHMNIERNIEFPLKMRKTDKDEIKEKIRQVLELVKLSGYEKRLPRQLSGGQQQRIALARALVFNPRVLLMDEPLGALDKKLREHMQLEIKQITQFLNITVIYVTHDQGEAMIMSDRIAVVSEGKIEQIGRPAEIYDNPKNYFVAEFIGESNFIKGQIEKSTHQTCHFTSEGGLICKIFSDHEKPIGSKVHLVIRPEKISFVEQGLSFDNEFEAIVEGMTYLGNITLYKARLIRDGTETIIKQMNKSINRQIKKCDKVRIGWDEKDNCVV